MDHVRKRIDIVAIYKPIEYKDTPQPTFFCPMIVTVFLYKFLRRICRSLRPVVSLSIIDIIVVAANAIVFM